jgi:hypothetical protein
MISEKNLEQNEAACALTSSASTIVGAASAAEKSKYQHRHATASRMNHCWAGEVFGLNVEYRGAKKTSKTTGHIFRSICLNGFDGLEPIGGHGSLRPFDLGMKESS